MNVVYACEPFPRDVTHTLYLAGPNKLNVRRSWRVAALATLEALCYEGHVFVPEPRPVARREDGDACADAPRTTYGDGEAQRRMVARARLLHIASRFELAAPPPPQRDGDDDGAERRGAAAVASYDTLDPDELLRWERECMHACDVVVFWFDRTAKCACADLNDQFGEAKCAGLPMVLGVPPGARGVYAQRAWAARNGVNVFASIAQCLHWCTVALTAASVRCENAGVTPRRTGAAARVPVHVWSWPPFVRWRRDDAASDDDAAIASWALVRYERERIEVGGGASAVRLLHIPTARVAKSAFDVVLGGNVTAPITSVTMRVGVRAAPERVHQVRFETPLAHIFAYHRAPRGGAVSVVLLRRPRRALPDTAAAARCGLVCGRAENASSDLARSDTAAHNCTPCARAAARLWRRATGVNVTPCARFASAHDGADAIEADARGAQRLYTLYTVRLTDQERAQLETPASGGGGNDDVVVVDYAHVRREHLDLVTIGMLELAMRGLRDSPSSEENSAPPPPPPPCTCADDHGSGSGSDSSSDSDEVPQMAANGQTLT